MGANYYRIIMNLISFKEELKLVEGKKFKPLIFELEKYQIPEDDFDDNIPSNKEIANNLGLPSQKVNILLRELYTQLLRLFSDQPLEVNECRQIIHIHFPNDEMVNRGKRKKYVYNPQLDKFIKVKLAVIPRLGEKISLNFIESEFGVHRGYVHEIEHRIIGKVQQIYISVHPTRNFYYQWNKMKEEHDYYERMSRTQNQY
jgi:hypothetical protein